jgi:hypothetical protein
MCFYTSNISTKKKRLKARSSITPLFCPLTYLKRKSIEEPKIEKKYTCDNTCEALNY